MISQYLIFNLNKELYGISIQAVKEIRAWETPRALYGTDSYVMGIINLRRVSVPIVDLQAYMGGTPTPEPEKCVVMILNLHDQLIGILVDDVSDIMDIAREQLSNHTAGAINQKLMKGTYNDDDKTILLFSTETLLAEYAASTAAEEGADTDLQSAEG